jgi:UPF0755 protein
MNAKKIGLGILDAIVKIVFVIIVVMLISKYAKLAYNYGYHIFNQTPVSSGTGRSVSFTVGSGDSVDTIATNLASVGLITDKNLFKLQERFSEYHGKEKAGTYELSTAMTPEEMITIMAGSQDGSEESQSEAADYTESGSGDNATEDTGTEAGSEGEGTDGG